MSSKYVLGIDYGTESGRALLVDVATGRELATAVYPYSHGVMDHALPDGTPLPHEWALQDPEDYLRCLEITIPQVLEESGVSPDQIIGMGIDFTTCTVLPTLADGTPLCTLPQFRGNPHAWVKLWKHHAAQPQADHINELGRRRGEEFIHTYGGKYSCEWAFSKLLETAEEAPEVYRACERFLEASDWVVWQMTGQERRSSCLAGYKSMWSKEKGFPDPGFFTELHPLFADLQRRLATEYYAPGARAGELSESMARRTGLRPGIAVAVANGDAHAAVPACTVVGTGRMVMIMGTSICHMLNGDQKKFVEGMCGVVEDGIIPGLWGFEAGQSAVGDIFAWFFRTCVPESYANEAKQRGIDIHDLLEEKAARLRPGQIGMIALDWWNGNRSILVDGGLTGLLVGATLRTQPEEIYRALIEATAFGTRTIVEAMEKAGVPVHDLVACGGLPEKNKLLMQIYADVTGKNISVSASPQTCALGAAMHGAVAAGAACGGYDTIQQAAATMAHLQSHVWQPDAQAHRMYTQVYAEYMKLHDYFGRGVNPVMYRLRELRDQAIEGAAGA